MCFVRATAEAKQHQLMGWDCLSSLKLLLLHSVYACFQGPASGHASSAQLRLGRGVREFSIKRSQRKELQRKQPR